ncbi:DUF6369 family protein [Maribacter huludaoensis]|uniref:DUF6369 family protein n=1 Tax=Maribacter huludaoensis TaxID=3030010 RepID=UPI0023EE0680|nr:DUF6369 family protein [Maribacter huludaoensis]MDF4220172.1 DUF6369 family protein [Maribacter huludaoensis]
MISTIVFSLLLMLYFALGGFFWKTRSIKYFIILTLLLPLSSVFTQFHTKFQIIVYYGFIAVPTSMAVFNYYYKNKISKNAITVTVVLLCFFLFYLTLGFFFNTAGISVINILKDAKPIGFLIVGFILQDLVKNKQIDWDGKFSKKVLIWNCIVTIFFFLLVSNTNLLSTATEDPFYQKSGMRYASVGIFYALFYLLAKLATNKKVTLLEFLYIFIPIFISGNRTLLLVIFLCFIINTFLSLSNPVSFIKKALVLVLGLFGLVVGTLSLNETLRARVVSLLDIELLLTELAEKRFSPFFIKLADFSWYNYLVGKGIGETFFIPWFAYRPNIDNFNIYMDNIYLTLYVKYGFGLILLFICLFYFINKTRTNKRFKILVITYFLLIGLTTSYMYQSSFLFLLILLLGFKTTHKDELLST